MKYISEAGECGKLGEGERRILDTGDILYFSEDKFLFQVKVVVDRNLSEEPALPSHEPASLSNEEAATPKPACRPEEVLVNSSKSSENTSTLAGFAHIYIFIEYKYIFIYLVTDHE